VNKCSEVKYGVFRVEVKIRKEQTEECTGVSARAAGLLNGGAGFEPTTSTAGKRRCITNVAGDLPLYHRSPQRGAVVRLVSVWSLINLAFPNTGSREFRKRDCILRFMYPRFYRDMNWKTIY